MSLKISKQIEICRPQKIGRNEPCFCGSGKKYKKCCLKKEQEYLSGANKGQTSRLVEWAMKQSFFREALEKKIKEFFGKEKIEETEFYGLIEALLFEEKIGGKRPLERFIESASLSEEEKLIYQSWLEKSFFSIFEVVEVNLGKSLKLKDLIKEQDYFVLERMGAYQIEKGAILATRLLPFQEFWMFGGGLGLMFTRSDEIYWLKRNLKNMPSPSNLELDFIKVFYGKKEAQKKTIKKLSYEEVKKILTDLLKKHQVSCQINELEAMILENKFEFHKVFEELAKKTTNREELDELADIVHHYWRSHPKFKKIGEPGSKEKILAGQMMTEFNQMIMNKNLERLPAKEINKLSAEFSEKWLNTPQQELENKTPKEVIVEERTIRGLKEKEPNYKLSFASILSSFPPEEEAEWVEKYNEATRLMAKEYRYLKALELFSELYPKIDLLKEKFRWYGKVATCLINLGKIELGKKYFKKSLELNPNYDISLKNLKTLSESQNLEKIKNLGRQELFYSLLEKGAIFTIPETEKKEINQCELLQDVVNFLEFLVKDPIPVSLKQRLLRFNEVLIINKKLIHPDLEVVEIGNTSSPYRYEWQMPKVKFLHLLGLAGKLTQEKSNKLVLTLKGEKFLTENKEKQFSQIFSIWFTKLHWKIIEDVQWRPNILAPLAEALQIQSWQILETLGKFGEKKFNRQEFLDNVFSIDKYNKKEEFAKNLSLFFINKVILEYLSWANIIRPEEKTKRSLFAEYNKFSVTRFGLSLINSIREEMDNAIPLILKKLV